jgi:hypothetical protein
VSYEARAGQTLAVEDRRLAGTQRIAFEPAGDEVRLSLTLEYRLKERSLITPIIDMVFIRRALQASLQRTLARFGHERRAELTRAALD